MTHPFPPLVEAYLADLDRALEGADPRERSETLAAVREHTREALALRGSDDDAVRHLLEELGPVDSIAAAAGTPAPAPASGPPLADTLLVVLSVVSLVLFIVPLFAVGTVVWAGTRLRAGAGDRSRQKTALVIGVVALVAFLAVLVSHYVATA
ncbi:HAAS signaling domain-containing protein [Cellulosimicrobium sp. 22601]|uniref:HAAS signaling domain-containing protein n=1 Tax=unclassified Cellulosimicrobium TaxID=2624466 RepID=UPI003F85CC27